MITIITYITIGVLATVYMWTLGASVTYRNFPFLRWKGYATCKHKGYHCTMSERYPEHLCRSCHQDMVGWSICGWPFVWIYFIGKTISVAWWRHLTAPTLNALFTQPINAIVNATAFPPEKRKNYVAPVAEEVPAIPASTSAVDENGCGCYNFGCRTCYPADEAPKAIVGTVGHHRTGTTQPVYIK